MKHSRVELAKNVSRETFARLETYAGLLERWNQKINLTGPKDDIWKRHIGDCAQLFDLLSDPYASILDMGSGAGLPGLVLAMLGAKDVHLAESDQKKVAFLREAARVTNTPVTLHAQRVETLAGRCFAVITARALAPLADLLSLAFPLLEENAFCLFPKGENYLIEVEEARARWQFDLTAHPSHTHPGAAILAIRNLRPVNG